MFEKMRTVFGPISVGLIIGSIALVFVFYGVFNPRSTSGVGAGAVAAEVNGDVISLKDFEREYQQRIEMYSGMMKGKVDLRFLEQLGLKQQVLEELVTRKLMLQAAEAQGLVVSDEELRDKIEELPYFKDKKSGQFDPSLYRKLLDSNRRSATEFESLVREDLMRAKFYEFLQSTAKASAKEVEQAFFMAENKRQVDYVMIGRDAAKAKLLVSEAEVQGFLKAEANVNAAKQYFETNKARYTKLDIKTLQDKSKKQAPPQFPTFDEVRVRVTQDLLREKRSEEVNGMLKKWADEALAKARSNDFRAYLKSKNWELKTSEKFSQAEGKIPSLGDVAGLMDDAFSENSALYKEPKIYENAGNFYLVTGLKSFPAKAEDFSKNKETFEKSVQSRKENEIFSQWRTQIRQKSKVSMNNALLAAKDE